MRAVLTDEPFSDPGWSFERKLDGIRCLACKADRAAARAQRPRPQRPVPRDRRGAGNGPVTDMVLDGEIVAFDGAQASFARLQRRGERPTPVCFSVFDILRVTGKDATDEPPRTRKRPLRQALMFAHPIRMTAHRNRDREALLADACRKGWEGPIARRADARDTDGRSRDWPTFKCSAEQELVVGG